jgi:hypothetical protein
MGDELKWSTAPTRTEWGEGMMVADVALDNDSTLTMYCHKNDLAKVRPNGAREVKLLEGELLALRQAAKEAAVAMAQHMPHRKETHDLYAFLTETESSSCCGHASDCAVHNEPAFPAGPCDCGAEKSNALRPDHPLAPGRCVRGIGMSKNCPACLKA